MFQSEVRKALVALIGSIAAMLGILGIDAGGLTEIFTAERIDTIAAVIATGVMVAGTVWGVPNEPSKPSVSAPDGSREK